MPSLRRLAVLISVALLAGPWAWADDVPELVTAPPREVAEKPAKAEAGKLPLSNLAPAKLFAKNCVLKYRVSTNSPECQAYFDQGLGYFYSYIWMEAARSFETAAKYDPDCAMAWWGLSRSLERWSKGDGNNALKKAQEKMASASHREQLLITARMQEKGLVAGLADDQKKKTAAKTIDSMLVLYDEDEEAWYYRAQLCDSNVHAFPYYKALLRINPLHPGANHELVHFYENQKRPALGMPYAENYMKSSPGMPHAFHMQAHLATRLGRWDLTTDRSARAIELQRAYHRDQGVSPREDHQFSHHLEILTLSLTHDGRFAEAKKIKAEATAAGYRHPMPWFRLHLAAGDWDEALKLADQQRKTDKSAASYMRALVYLREGKQDLATAEVEVLQLAFQNGKTNKQLENRLWEAQGLLMCQTGGAEAGLKLLQKLVERTKDDFSHHAWGNGAVYMEPWGIAALQSGHGDVAEEGLLEALAHDPGSVRAALGMQVLCERRGQTEDALRYAALAQRFWQKADKGCLDAEMEWIRKEFKEERGPSPRGEVP